MKADLNLDQVLRLARVLKPATAPAWHGAGHFLHLHVMGDRLTITAANLELTAQVHLPGGLSDGNVAVVPQELIAALKAVAPSGRGRNRARVSVHADLDRLHLDGPAASVTVDAQDSAPPDPSGLGDEELGIVQVPAGTWLAALRATLPAAGTNQTLPRLCTLHLHRDRGACLLAEATDRYRIHRVRIGQPDPAPVDLHLPADQTSIAAKILTAAAADPADPLQITATADRVTWRTATTMLAVSTIPDGLPDLEHFFERAAEADLHFSIDAGAMAQACTRADAVAERSQPVRLQVTPTSRTLTVTVDGAHGAPPRLALDLPIGDVRGPAATLALNPTLAIELFTAAGDGSAQVGVHTNRYAPISVQAEGFHGLLIPIRTTDDRTTDNHQGEPAQG